MVVFCLTFVPCYTIFADIAWSSNSYPVTFLLFKPSLCVLCRLSLHFCETLLLAILILKHKRNILFSVNKTSLGFGVNLLGVGFF